MFYKIIESCLGGKIKLILMYLSKSILEAVPAINVHISDCQKTSEPE